MRLLPVGLAQPWQPGNNTGLPPRGGLAAVYAGGYLYAIGGDEFFALCHHHAGLRAPAVSITATNCGGVAVHASHPVRIWGRIFLPLVFRALPGGGQSSLPGD